MNSISAGLLVTSKKAKAKLVTKFSKKVLVSDVIRVIEEVVSAQYNFVWMTNIMLHSSVYPTASLSAQTWFIRLRFSQLLMVRHGNQGEGAGYGKVRKSG